MADDVDIAQDLQAAQIAQALALRKRNDVLTESRVSCLQCSAKIPEARRVAEPGRQLCVKCKEIEEQGGFW